MAADAHGRPRGRIEAVLDWAITREYRTGENPARSRGRLQQLLPAKTKIRRVENHPAMGRRDVGASLCARPAPAVRALEFLVLTAARGGEARGARWAEIDLAGGAWTVAGDALTIAGARMKACCDH